MNSKTTIELLFLMVSLGGMIAISGLMIGQKQQQAYAANIDEDGLGFILKDLDRPLDEDGLGFILKDLDIALDEEDIPLDEDGLGFFLKDLDLPLDEE